MIEAVPTFVQRVESYRFFDEAIENRQLTHFLVISGVFHSFDLASDELDVLWTSTELQENEMEILSLIQCLSIYWKSAIPTIHGW